MKKGKKPFARYDKVVQMLQDVAPHGHPEFIPKMVEAVRLHSDKNWDYAGEGDPFGNFNRVAAMCDALFTDADPTREERLKILLIYMAKQFDAVIDCVGHGREVKVEALSHKLLDIAIYAQLGRIMLEEGE